MSHIIKTFTVSDVIHNDNTICISIVAIRDSSKPFLPSCIPLHKTKNTKTSFALSPSKLTILVFYMS